MTKKAHPKKRVHGFIYKGFMTCQSCGCVYTASLKKKKHIYYYCTNGKGKCEEHKSYLKEDNVNLLVADLIKENLEIPVNTIDLCHKASLESAGENDDYLEVVKNNLENQIEKLTRRKKVLSNKLLDEIITNEFFKQTETEIHNEITKIKKELNDLKAKNSVNKKIASERTKKLFLACNNRRKEFLNFKEDKKQKLLNNLLWNATIENKKIASFSFKMPYQLVANIDKNSDFSDLRGIVDDIRTYYYNLKVGCFVVDYAKVS